MPDDKAAAPDDDENEYGSQAHADKVEGDSGNGRGDASGHDKADAAERGSGGIKD